MRSIWIDAHGRVRNGWWILVFVAIIAISRPLYSVVSDGLTSLGVTDLGKEPLGFLFILAVTWICTRMRRESLGDVGLGLSPRHGIEFAVGLGVACVAIALVALLMALTAGVAFVPNTEGSLRIAAQAFYVFTFAALMEELLFRGFVFQRLVAGTNPWIAQGALATLFAAGHLSNPGMETHALWVGSLDLALGAIVFGLAYLKTGRLALPVGLHLGWNWMQGAVLGFNVSGHAHAGLFEPVLGDGPGWLTGGEFGLEASVCAIAVDVLLIVALLSWRRGGEQKRSASVCDSGAEYLLTVYPRTPPLPDKGARGQ